MIKLQMNSMTYMNEDLFIIPFTVQHIQVNKYKIQNVHKTK